jgi:hypothetical protein
LYRWELNDGKPIHSGQFPYPGYNPENAFDDDLDTFWEGHPDSSGLLWLGMEYDKETTIRCVRYYEMSGYGSTQVSLQVFDTSQGQWVSNLTEKVGQLPGGWKMIN